MRVITKGQEPGLLTHYRSKPGAIYDGENFTKVKAAIRKHLLKEQGYLCAYCMKRIMNNEFRTKIEHWQCQTNYPNKQLDYKNMLAVCLGKTIISNSPDRPKFKTHCDTLKGKKDIKFNPSNASHHSHMKIYYGVDGKIYSRDTLFQKQIDEILNLNLDRIKNNRKAIIDSIFDYLSRYKGSCSTSFVLNKIKKWESINSKGYLSEFCDVSIYFLNKKLKQISK